MGRHEESQYTHKEACPACGSRDNLARYTDGHGYCFGCGHYEHPDGQPPEPRTRQTMTEFRPYSGDVRALKARGINETTCQLFEYTVGTARMQVEPGVFRDVLCQIAPYFKDGALVGQHLRDAEKHFAWAGSMKGCELFGQHLWRDGGKRVVITEGEIDCMSVSQAQGNKWPVVSIPSGVKAAKKSLQDNLEWLERFDEVVLMFDNDEPGREAVAECAPLFTPGKCRVANLKPPYKDANDALRASDAQAIIDSLWGAKPYRPDGIRAVHEIAEEAEKDIPWGTPWWHSDLTDATYGRRDGELYAFGAGTGVGKTDWFTQSIAYDVLTLGIPTGVIYLEQPVVETLRRVAGKAVGKVLHVPGKASVEDRREAIALLTAADNLFLYDRFGSCSWDDVSAKIRFMALSLGCKHIYLDHLTALTAQEDDERKALDVIMEKMASLALELKVKMHFISHLSRPTGDSKPHEEGGRVMVRHFRGSNAIGMWSHFMFGLERNTQAEDEASRAVTTFRVIKDRNTGTATGMHFRLGYDRETGRLLQLGEEEGESPFGSSEQSDDIPF